MAKLSGWCMRPDEAQHRLCRKNFTSGACECECSHEGERPLPEAVRELGTRPQGRRKKTVDTE
jgi:hypothetical protein